MLYTVKVYRGILSDAVLDLPVGRIAPISVPTIPGLHSGHLRGESQPETFVLRGALQRATRGAADDDDGCKKKREMFPLSSFCLLLS